jgi:SAM-dependent methyltransferase
VDAFDYKMALPETPGFSYHNMSMTDIKFDNDTFDYVFAMSSIEHINAGNFAIPNMSFDTGDELAMSEMVRVLKPGGIIVVTTDFSNRYYPPPGLWKSGSHRIYNWEEFNQRLVLPFDVEFFDEIDHEYNWDNLMQAEPKGYAYTEFIATLKKKDIK